MSLTPETGSGLDPTADTYATVAELRAYASKRGVTVPADDGDCEVLLTKAMDYIEAQSGRWKGEPVTGDQPLSWPRYCVVVNGYELDSSVIPNDIKKAQCQLAIDAQTIDLMPNIDAASQRGPVIEETVDVISVAYAEPGVNRSVSSFAAANGLLAKYYAAGSGQIKLVRA